MTANSIIFFDLAGCLASCINFGKMYDNSNTLNQEIPKYEPVFFKVR